MLTKYCNSICDFLWFCNTKIQQKQHLNLSGEIVLLYVNQYKHNPKNLQKREEKDRCYPTLPHDGGVVFTSCIVCHDLTKKLLTGY